MTPPLFYHQSTRIFFETASNYLDLFILSGSCFSDAENPHRAVQATNCWVLSKLWVCKYAWNILEKNSIVFLT